MSTLEREGSHARVGRRCAPNADGLGAKPVRFVALSAALGALTLRGLQQCAGTQNHQGEGAMTEKALPGIPAGLTLVAPLTTAYTRER